MSIQQVFTLAKEVFTGVGVLLLVSHFVCSLAWPFLVLSLLRQLKMLPKAKTSPSTSLDASKVSSCGSTLYQGPTNSENDGKNGGIHRQDPGYLCNGHKGNGTESRKAWGSWTCFCLCLCHPYHPSLPPYLLPPY
ncbi:hypothetical protein H4582DRAFT_495942 [Lactarius indigo]|nr:hypothetical protein H4582DRAFT_495942 [Lactarius indigo]